MKGTPELTGRENMYLSGGILGMRLSLFKKLNSPDVLMMKPAEDWY
jgi:hypothetical protein